MVFGMMYKVVYIKRFGEEFKVKYIMAMDQGTTSSRCIIFDKSGTIISKAQKEFKQIYPKQAG
jgi:glycerol kinase